MPSCVSLSTPDATYHDIQIWNDASAPPLSLPTLQYVCLVNHRKIPLYLVSSGAYNVYSTAPATEAYFLESAITHSETVAVLAKHTDAPSDAYVVFFADHSSLSVKCFCIDFSVLERVARLSGDTDRGSEVSIYYSNTERAPGAKSDIAVFDRVLESKSSRKSAPQPPRAPPPTLLAGPHLTQAINKVILSGLRLRGLSISARDKIAVREIYQMTRKAALFALRKYTYDFNSALPPDLTLDVVQDVVESLLRVFVDVEQPL